MRSTMIIVFVTICFSSFVASQNLEKALDYLEKLSKWIERVERVQLYHGLPTSSNRRGIVDEYNRNKAIPTDLERVCKDLRKDESFCRPYVKKAETTNPRDHGVGGSTNPVVNHYRWWKDGCSDTVGGRGDDKDYSIDIPHLDQVIDYLEKIAAIRNNNPNKVKRIFQETHGTDRPRAADVREVCDVQLQEGNCGKYVKIVVNGCFVRWTKACNTHRFMVQPEKGENGWFEGGQPPTSK